MTLKKLLVTLSVASIGLCSTYQSVANDKDISPKREKQLVHLLKQDCGSCHGMTLKGGLGPALLPENLKGKPELFLTNTILFGRPGTAMPPWKEIITEKEAKWLTKQLTQGVVSETKQ